MLAVALAQIPSGQLEAFLLSVLRELSALGQLRPMNCSLGMKVHSGTAAGRDLRALLALLRRKSSTGSVPSHTRLVLQALSSMAYHEGPTAFFDFSDPAAGIMRTSNLKFPSTRGYSFATWLRLEDLKHDPAEAGRAVFALLSRSVDSTKGIVVAMKGEVLAGDCRC